MYRTFKLKYNNLVNVKKYVFRFKKKKKTKVFLLKLYYNERL